MENPDDREDVHSLIAREHAVGDDGVRLGRAHRSQRVHDAGDDHDHDAGHQKRREHLTHHIDDARRPQGQQKHHGEECDRKRQQPDDVAEPGGNGHLEGSGGAARRSDEHAHAQDGGGVQRQAGLLAQGILDGEDGAPRVVDGEHAHAGDHHVEEHEAR